MFAFAVAVVQPSNWTNGGFYFPPRFEFLRICMQRVYWVYPSAFCPPAPKLRGSGMGCRRGGGCGHILTMSFLKVKALCFWRAHLWLVMHWSRPPFERKQRFRARSGHALMRGWFLSELRRVFCTCFALHIFENLLNFLTLILALARHWAWYFASGLVRRCVYRKWLWWGILSGIFDHTLPHQGSLRWRLRRSQGIGFVFENWKACLETFLGMLE